MMDRVKVVGAGLAGCEAAWQLAKRGVDVDLYEMKGQGCRGRTGRVRSGVAACKTRRGRGSV